MPYIRLDKVSSICFVRNRYRGSGFTLNGFAFSSKNLLYMVSHIFRHAEFHPCCQALVTCAATVIDPRRLHFVSQLRRCFHRTQVAAETTGRVPLAWCFFVLLLSIPCFPAQPACLIL